MFEHITTIELAGYGVGAFLLCATISAPKIDSLISTSQRSSMGMCKRCGDLKMIACSGCKGLGLIKEGGPFNIIPVDNVYQSKMRSIGCTKCQSRGSFSCPECANLSEN
ncbi:uncharacterized protein LOC131304517 [Rhododendron vialii]|uniref:uncharacterized protein LOC131304517 n=1 Tax=Rhododendron vialii TaxID=182163 RepID=UPI00265DC055|nr:uncharacterized protein LOC131304517 [Rhododendron vialii]